MVKGSASVLLDALAQKAARIERCVARVHDMAVHDYDAIDMGVVVRIIQSELAVVLKLAGLILNRYQAAT